MKKRPLAVIRVRGPAPVIIHRWHLVNVGMRVRVTIRVSRVVRVRMRMRVRWRSVRVIRTVVEIVQERKRVEPAEPNERSRDRGKAADSKLSDRGPLHGSVIISQMIVGSIGFSGAEKGNMSSGWRSIDNMDADMTSFHEIIG
jgi:hypothetical protein